MDNTELGEVIYNMCMADTEQEYDSQDAKKKKAKRGKKGNKGRRKASRGTKVMKVNRKVDYVVAV